MPELHDCCRIVAGLLVLTQIQYICNMYLHLFSHVLCHSCKIVAGLLQDCCKIVSSQSNTIPGVAPKSLLAQKYAFTKKSTIFTQSLRNLAKIIYTWVGYFDQVSYMIE